VVRVRRYYGGTNTRVHLSSNTREFVGAMVVHIHSLVVELETQVKQDWTLFKFVGAVVVRIQ